MKYERPSILMETGYSEGVFAGSGGLDLGTDTITDTTTAETTDSTTTETTTSEVVNSGCTCEQTAAWGDEWNGYTSQYNCYTSAELHDGWSVVLTFDKNITGCNAWASVPTCSGNTVVMTQQSYNATLAAGSNLGFQVMSSEGAPNCTGAYASSN